MEKRLFTTFLWKVLFSILVSLVSLALVLSCGYYVTALVLWFNPSSSAFVTSLLRWIINNIGSTPIMSIVGVLLFFVFFFFFSRNILKYIEEITFGVEEIARGKLTHRIPVKSEDELGIVAKSINQMAERLKQSIEEERSAVKGKSDLITGVSHDLRTPLTSIIGFLEYIENDKYMNEVELRYYVNIVYEKSLNLKKLIDDLFEYTRLTSGEIQLEFEKLDLSGLLRQLIEEFVPLLEQANMKYHIKGPSETVYIQADPNELVRVYENLFTNAIRYAKDGKQLDISITSVDDYVVVNFTNYGPPIPESDLPYIFDRFYRVDKSRTKSSGGSGLGLAITKSIVEKHGGLIWVKSNKKQTEFITQFLKR
ncbi:HAMP domain-containing histidine kinase [Paenibacillus sp. sptzw28]|uniref:sensor histidine kinase n=1 Tax=Paenibacillus sp. sptzw28 TaxID=715179 RepID=UPI001C6F55AB|nr:HAMP domain-containing sensor histidine kinase [Paenibacillus sp. sptzw28]QYR21115.1 HAMP domain-containing histidine kinase [Paenibacillus sp. sptzw28]